MNRLNIKKLWPTIALGLLASCATDVEQEAQQGGVAISLTAEEQNAAALTRAASTADLQNTAFAAGEDVAVFVVDRANASTYASTPYRFRASAVDGAGQNALTYYSDATTASVLCYPITPSASIDIYGFYPYSLFASVSDRTTDDLAISVSADQSTAAAYRASDVMMATAITDQARTESTVNLQFSHLMAKLVVRLKQGVHAGSSSAVTAAELAGSILTIGGVTTEATLDMTDGTVTTGSNSTTVTLASDADLAFYYSNSDAVLSTTEYAIVLPAQALTGKTVTLTTSAGETITGTLPEIDLTVGGSNVLTLTVNDSGIEATRADYGNGGSNTWEKNPFEDLTASDVGKVICSDGTVCAYADRGSKTPVALIFYVGSAGETDATYNHGLAIALTDCANKAEWGGFGTDQSTFTNVTSISGVNGDLAGIVHTNVMKDLSPNTSGHKVAGKVAQDYGTAISNTSGWFLPTAGQWNLFLDYCGYKLTAWASYQHGSTGFDAINTKLTDVGGTALQSGFYWSSSENAKKYGVCVYFNYSSAVGVNVSLSGKVLTGSVRAFLAF